MAVKIRSCVYGKCVIPQRYLLCLMMVLGMVMAYSMRVCLHISITEMVISLEQSQFQRTANTHECPDRRQNIALRKPTDVNAVESCIKQLKVKKAPGSCSYCYFFVTSKKTELFKWTEEEQGIILASFFPGYVITHLPGGILADKFGGKYVFSCCVGMSAVFTVLTPVAAEYGSWWCLTIIRFVMGIAQGPVFPSMITLLARWVPPREKGILVTITATGTQIGTITGNLVSSFLIAYTGDWIIVFYFWGSISIIWYIIFILLCHSEPAQHPFITEEEMQMLADEIGTPEKFKIPWKKLLLYPPIWALIFCGVGHDFVFYLVIVQLPKYMSDVLKLDIQQNGIINAVPYIALIFSSTISGVIADIAINKNILSVLNTRKIFATIGTTGPAIFVALIPYMGCDENAVGTMLVLTMVIMGPYYAGMTVNAFDITKNFAGVVMAIVNGLAAVAYIPVPYLIAIVASNHMIDEWKIVMWALFAVCVICNILFVICASADRAEWDQNPPQL